jgi:hypothetical protein
MSHLLACATRPRIAAPHYWSPVRVKLRLSLKHPYVSFRLLETFHCIGSGPSRCAEQGRNKNCHSDPQTRSSQLHGMASGRTCSFYPRRGSHSTTLSIEQHVVHHSKFSLPYDRLGSTERLGNAGGFDSADLVILIESGL